MAGDAQTRRRGMAEALALALGLLMGLLALAGAVCALLSLQAVRRLAARAPLAAPALPASILKPLHGVEPGLAENLAATLAQAHAAPFEVLFAVRDPADPATALAEAAMAAAP